MPPVEYQILLDNKIIDRSYTRNSFESMLNIYKKLYNERVTTFIKDLTK